MIDLVEYVGKIGYILYNNIYESKYFPIDTDLDSLLCIFIIKHLLLLKLEESYFHIEKKSIKITL